MRAVLSVLLALSLASVADAATFRRIPWSRIGPSYSGELLRECFRSIDSYLAALSAAGVGETGTAEAPDNASYVVLGANAALTSERTLTIASPLTGVDAGANSTFTIDLPQRAFTVNSETNIVLTANGTPSTALIDSIRLVPSWQGTLAISRGGTGQSTALAAFNALSPLTTRGDLLTRDASNNVRIAIGGAGKTFTTNGTDPSWSWYPVWQGAVHRWTADPPGKLITKASAGEFVVGDTTLTMGPYTHFNVGIWNMYEDITGASGFVIRTGAVGANTRIGQSLSLVGTESRTIRFPHARGTVVTWSDSSAYVMPNSGSLLYGAATTASMRTLAIGSTGDVLTVASGLPAWAAPTTIVDVPRRWTTLQSFRDDAWRVTGSTDTTKRVTFELDGATASDDLVLDWDGTDDRTVNIPDATTTLVGTLEASTISGQKTFTQDNSTPPIFQDDATSPNAVFKTEETSSGFIASWQFASVPAGNYSITFPGSASTLVGTTTTQTLTNKEIDPRTETLADATSISPNGNTSDVSIHVNTQAIGTLTVNNPTAGAAQGKIWILRIKSTNVQTFAWGTQFRGGTTLALPTVTSGASLTDYFRFVRNATDTKWDIIDTKLGY